MNDEIIPAQSEEQDMDEVDEGELMYEEDVLEIVDGPVSKSQDEDFSMNLSDSPDSDSDSDSNLEIELDPKDDNCILRFTQHTSPVFSIASHPIAPHICASGGGDDLAFIWNSFNGTSLNRLDGFKDSVSFVSFSFDGKYLATASVEGLIKIWVNENQTTIISDNDQWKFLVDLEGSEEVTWISWHPRGNVILAGFADGLSTMWTIPTGETMQVFSGFSALPTSGQFTPDGKTIVIGSEDSRLIVFDPPTGQPIHKLNLREGKHRFLGDQDHNSGISSLAINRSSTICSIGGLSNGGLRLLNLRTGLLLISIDGNHEPEATIQTAFYDPLNNSNMGLSLLISTGTDGKIFVYDGTSFKLRASMQHPEPITTLLVHHKQPRLTTGSVDKTLISWDLRTGSEIFKYTAHFDMVHHAVLNCDETRLISASEDGTVCVFEVVD